MANAESAIADIPSFRYRVSGMDCAKDAAQIERAAQSAGIAPDAVKVSTATHIMTLTAPEARLPESESAQFVHAELSGMKEPPPPTVAPESTRWATMEAPRKGSLSVR